MKILYDHQTFTLQNFGGISRYYFELINRFKGNDTCSVATTFTNNAYLNKNTYPNVMPFFPKNKFNYKPKIMNFVNQNKSLSQIKKSDFDVFHPTYYNDYFLKDISDKPFVVTFYDMIHEKISNKFSELNLNKKIYNQKKILIERSSKIIAISETTKKDIIDIFDVSEDKIEVVYLGNSLKNSSVGTKRIVYEDYILFVGNRSSYKNFEGLLKVMPELLIMNSVKLVCAGGGGFNLDEVNLINSMGLFDNVISLRDINDDILANLYSNALFFVFPSFYEGFGIPVLESFACGCPALLSDGGSLPEIGGSAAQYFNPNDQQSLYLAALNLLSNEKLRLELKDKGTERLQKFSWDNTFDNTLNVYKKII